MNGEICTRRDLVARLVLGTLPEDEERVVLAHLETCPACTAIAHELEQKTDPIIDALRHAPPAPLPAAPATPTYADRVQIPGYRILEEVGRGGMGVVYRAHQDRLNRTVAIKMILAGQLANVEDHVRFRMEGALLARLNHPNFVQVHEVGTVEISPGTVQSYLVLEFVEGTTLRQEMAAGPMTFEHAARRMLELARAIEAAHAQGIVHRDLKPTNVLINRDGTLKITDFGLAKELSGDGSLTPTGITVGTPDYMAPEQAHGRAPVGPPTDIYALGSIFYEMLTGQTPFSGATAVDVIVQVLGRPPTSALRLRPELPRDLATICHKCLEKEPRARYASAGDLADDLAAWLEHRPIRARPVGRVERTVKWARRHPLPAALLASLVVTLISGTVASTYFAVLASRRADETQKALDQEAEARAASDRRAAELQFVAGQAAADGGEIGRGMFLMLRALSLVPEKDEAQRRVIRLNLDAWLPYLPRLRWYREITCSMSPVFLDDEVVVIQGNAALTFDAHTGQQKAIIRVPDDPIVALGPRGRRIATRTETKDGPVLRIFDRRTGEPVGPAIEDRGAVAVRRDQYNPLYSASFSDDEKLVARVVAGSWTAEHRTWDIATGKEIGPPLPESATSWSSLLRDADGHPYWLGLRNGMLDVVDVETGKLLGSSGILPPSVERPARTFPERSLVQGWLNPNELFFWDLQAGQPRGTSMRVPPTSLARVTSENGRNLAHLFVDHHIGWQEIGSQQPYWPLAEMGRGEATNGDWVSPAPAGWGCVHGARFKPRLKCYDFPSLVSRGILPVARRQMFHGAAFHPGGESAILTEAARAAGQPYARLQSTRDDHPLGVPLTDCDSRPTFSPSGRLLALCTFDDTRKGAQRVVRVYDAHTGEPRSPAWTVVPFMHVLDFSPDERRLAVGHVQGAEVLDLEGKTPPLSLPQRGPISRLRFSKDGTRLAMAGRAGWDGGEPGVQIWEVAPKKTIGERVPMIDAPLLFAGDSDDEFETVELDKGTRRRWDFSGTPGRNLGPLADWPGRIRAENGLAFDAARRRLAIGTPHGAIHRWDLRTGKRIEPDADFRQAVGILTWSADGRWLAAAGEDGTVALFDATSGQRVGPFLTHGSPILALTFSAGSDELLTVATNGHCRRWPVGKPQPFTPAQWHTWLEAATGLRIEADAVLAISAAAHDARVAEARVLPTPLFEPQAIVRWHQEELFHAEESGQLNSARWHLDRWIAKEPDNWLAWCRRARISILENDSSGAAADFERAAKIAPHEVEDWRRHDAALSKLVDGTIRKR
jgi:WD40 repeat protein